MLKLILRLRTASHGKDLNHLNSESFLQDCFARLHISLITLSQSVLTGDRPRRKYAVRDRAGDAGLRRHHHGDDPDHVCPLIDALFDLKEPAAARYLFCDGNREARRMTSIICFLGAQA